jgi:hypothetical protein
MDIDFVISFGIFLFLLSVMLGLYFSFQASTFQLTKSLELREETINFLTTLISEKGSPENWESQASIEELGLVSDIYRRQILVNETSGYSRTNEPVAVFINFDETCSNKTYKNPIRVYYLNQEIAEKISNITYCSGNYVKSALTTFFVNISANQSKVYTIYYSPFSSSEKNYSTNLVAYYTFDEASGTIAYDYSGNGNTGTLYNGSTICSGGNCPNWVDGKYGKAIKFDGVDDYVQVPDSSTLNLGTGDFTIIAWIKASFNQSVTYPQILSKRSGTTDGFLFGLWSDGKLYMQIAGTNYATATGPDLRDNTWHYVAVVRNGSIVTYYIDGTNKGSFTSTSNMNSTHSLWIGLDEPAISNTAFNGTIDEVRIYNRALTTQEIQTLYYASPLVVKVFPEEKVQAISPEKLNALKERNYEILRKELGQDYNFLIQITETG